MDGQINSSKGDELEGSRRANLLAVYTVISVVKTMGMLRKAAVDAARTIVNKLESTSLTLCDQKSNTGTLQLEPANLMQTRGLIQMYETVYRNEWSPSSLNHPASSTIEARWHFILKNAGTMRAKIY